MLTKALSYDLQTNQNIGMVDEKQKGLKIGKTRNNISTFAGICQVYSY